MDPWFLIPSLLALCATLYQILVGLCALRFQARKTPPPRGGRWPKAACLKPLCGDDTELAENLRSFLAQDYPDYEVLLGTASEEDSARGPARGLTREGGSPVVRLLAGEAGEGGNRKVRNLRNLLGHVSPDVEVLVLSDADIRVGPDYLRAVIAPLRDDSSAGASTTLYRVANPWSPGAMLEALSIETGFAPGVLVAEAFTPLAYAFGATIALRRKDFERAGGFQGMEDQIGDDYKLGERMHASGRRVLLAPHVVSTFVSQPAFGDALLHLLRWHRTIRVYRPGGYISFPIAYGSLWGLLGAFYSGFSGPALWVFLGACTFRVLGAWLGCRALGAVGTPLKAFLAPLYDLLAAGLWFAGLFGRTVIWRGVRYRVGRDGSLWEVP